MRFLLDANMPRSALSALRARGHVVDHVRDLGLGDASDERIATSAHDATAVLVSRDLDFADVRRFPPQNTPGFVVPVAGRHPRRGKTRVSVDFPNLRRPKILF